MASVIRVSVLGTMPGGEVWSVNPTWFLLDEPASISGAEALAIATAVDAITIPTALRAWLSTSTSFTGTRVEARDRNGLLEALGEHTRATPVPGTGSFAHPYQTSTVTSLRSTFPGARGRGRLYWPATGIGLTLASLRADPTILGTGLTAVRTYLAAIEAAVAASAGPAQLSVWSRTGSAFHRVVVLRQGDVLDTQRRRRDALTEAYTELPFPS